MNAPPNLNLPPDVAAALQEQVSKMSPAQIAAMMESVKGVDMAAAAAQAQAALSGVSADDVRRMGAAMASAPPEAVRANVAAVTARMSAEVAAAAKLKADGNAAFGRGDAAAAAAAWGRAADQLKAHASAEAVALRRACQLNLALAHLKLGGWADADAAASAVLAGEPGNAKALLRRGSARLGAGRAAAAVRDLSAALAAAAPGDKAVVQEKLDEARALVGEGGGDGVVEEADVEVCEEAAPAAPAPAAPAPPAMPFPAGALGGGLPTGPAAAAQAAQMRAFAAALRANPSLKDSVAAQAASMTPDQVAAAARAAGAAAPPPEALTPAGMAAAARAAASMTPEQLETMADALEKASGGPASPAGPSPAGAPPPPAAASSAADVAALMKDPAMVRQATSMLKAMDPKTVAAMSGGAVSEAQAAAMQAKLESLSDAQLAGLVRAAQGVQAAKAKVDAAKAWLGARPGVVAALVVLAVAVVLRRWGWV